MEFEEDEDIIRELPQPNYDSMGRLTIGGGSGEVVSAAPRNIVKYKECLKNHALGIGGNAVDGCGEFMAAGVEGTLEALKCAACNCHRNFHRKETEGEESMLSTSLRQQQQHHQLITPPYYHRPAGYLHMSPVSQQRTLGLPANSRELEIEEDVSNPSSSGGGGGGGGGGYSSSKRFRTKFTPDQKQKMFELAETLGWRIQRQDDALVQNFCAESGVSRHVLKVWMHNNKHTLGKKKTALVDE